MESAASDVRGGRAFVRSGGWALEATTDCVVLLDHDLRIVYVNRHAAALNGTVPEALVGRPHAEVWPQTVGTEVERRYREAMVTGVPAEFEYVYPDGPWHEIHAYPSEDGLAIFYRDVTEARRERERLEGATHASGIGVWRRKLTDRDAPVYWSPRMREHFRVAPDAPIEPGTLVEHIHPDDRERAIAAYRRALAEREPYDAVYRTIGGDGEVRWIHARGRAVYAADGTLTQFDGFTLDVTERLDVERQLREAKARLDATLASTEVATWVVDVIDKRVYGDRNLAALFGMDESSVEGGPTDDFVAKVHPEDFATIRTTLGQSVQEGVPYDIEFRTVLEDRERWLTARGFPERDDTGRVVRLPGVVLDVTARKLAQIREREIAERLRAKERRQRLRVDLMDALRGQSDPRETLTVACRMVGEFLGVCRTTYGLVDVDAQAIRMETGWANDVEPMSGVYRYEDFGLAVLRKIEEGLPFGVADTATDPLTGDRYEESYRPAEIGSFLVVPLHRDGVLTASISVHDCVPRVWTAEETELLEDVAQRAWDAVERIRAEDELRKLNAVLDARVRERTLELEQANEEMQGFTSTVSHDLRGPLRNIHGISQMLLQDADDRLTADEKALLGRQAHNAMRLAGIIDDLLKFSRLAREPLHKEPFDLSKLAMVVRDDFMAKESRGACSIEIAPDLQAVGDRRLVRFVLLNLLENACKFSPEGGTIRVGGTDEGAFFVSDEGIGFDMAYAAKIFQPFERLVSEKQFPGSGVGLANVHRIVQRHGGRIWADSRPGEGATFWFTLGQGPGDS